MDPVTAPVGQTNRISPFSDVTHALKPLEYGSVFLVEFHSKPFQEILLPKHGLVQPPV